MWLVTPAGCCYSAPRNLWFAGTPRGEELSISTLYAWWRHLSPTRPHPKQWNLAFSCWAWQAVAGRRPPNPLSSQELLTSDGTSGTSKKVVCHVTPSRHCARQGARLFDDDVMASISSRARGRVALGAAHHPHGDKLLSSWVDVRSWYILELTEQTYILACTEVMLQSSTTRREFPMESWEKLTSAAHHLNYEDVRRRRYYLYHIGVRKQVKIVYLLSWGHWSWTSQQREHKHSNISLTHI